MKDNYIYLYKEGLVLMNLKNSHIQGGFALILVLFLGVIHWINPTFYSTVWTLSTTGNMEGTIEYLRSFGYGAILISILIDVLINVVGFLPSIFISAANGVLFGIVPGILISWFAETVGVIISFAFMRTLLRNSAKKIIAQNNMMSKLDEYSTMKTMLIARAVPYSPNGLVTALGAVSRIAYRDYIIGCALGKFPSVAIEVLVGHDVIMHESNMNRLIFVVTAVVIVYGALWYYNRQKEKRERSES